MPSSHLILCHPLLPLPPIPSSIRIFSNESTLCMRWPKYWSFSFSIIPSKEIPGLISFRMDGWISLQSKGLSRVFSNTTVQKHLFFGAQPSSQSNSHKWSKNIQIFQIKTWEKFCVVGQGINGKILSDSGSKLQSELLKLYKEVETKKGTLMEINRRKKVYFHSVIKEKQFLAQLLFVLQSRALLEMQESHPG